MKIVEILKKGSIKYFNFKTFLYLRNSWLWGILWICRTFLKNLVIFQTSCEYATTYTCSPSSPVYAPHPWSHLPWLREGRFSMKPVVPYLETVCRFQYHPASTQPPVITTELVVASVIEQALLNTIYNDT